MEFAVGDKVAIRIRQDAKHIQVGDHLCLPDVNGVVVEVLPTKGAWVHFVLDDGSKAKATKKQRVNVRHAGVITHVDDQYVNVLWKVGPIVISFTVAVSVQSAKAGAIEPLRAGEEVHPAVLAQALAEIGEKV